MKLSAQSRETIKSEMDTYLKFLKKQGEKALEIYNSSRQWHDELPIPTFESVVNITKQNRESLATVNSPQFQDIIVVLPCPKTPQLDGLVSVYIEVEKLKGLVEKDNPQFITSFEENKHSYKVDAISSSKSILSSLCCCCDFFCKRSEYQAFVQNIERAISSDKVEEKRLAAPSLFVNHYAERGFFYPFQSFNNESDNEEFISLGGSINSSSGLEYATLKTVDAAMSGGVIQKKK